MTNTDFDSREFYDINWVKPEQSSVESNVSWPQSEQPVVSDVPSLLWTEDQLKKELFQYEVFLRKSLKALFEVTKSKSSRKVIASFEEDVRLYKEYVESTHVDTRLVAEMLMRPAFLSQYLSFFSEDKHQKILKRFNDEGPVKSVRRLRMRVVDMIRNKPMEQSMQDFYFDLPKDITYFWPNVMTIELAFQAIIQRPDFVI
jgi:hypothetical protein